MREIVTISIHQCKSGMIIADSIYNDVGGVIIGKDYKLDNNIIQKLFNFEVRNIKVYKDSTINISNRVNIEELTNTYSSQINVLQEVVKDINSGRKLGFDKIENIVDSLTQSFKNDDDIISCFKIIKDIGEYLYNHSINVALLSALIGKWIGLSKESVNDLTYAGLLHDIGKAKVNFKILNKSSALTEEETEKLNMHVTHGYKMLQTIPKLNKDIELGVLMHHERIDGKGFTLGASGDQIHIFGRIIAIANKYDYYINLLKNNPFKVFEKMRSHTFDELDPSITLTFLKTVSEYYIGDMFKLNTGEYGEVISINSNDISRPLIRIDNSFINLSEERDIWFEELV